MLRKPYRLPICSGVLIKQATVSLLAELNNPVKKFRLGRSLNVDISSGVCSSGLTLVPPTTVLGVEPFSFSNSSSSSRGLSRGPYGVTLSICCWIATRRAPGLSKLRYFGGSTGKGCPSWMSSSSKEFTSSLSSTCNSVVSRAGGSLALRNDLSLDLPAFRRGRRSSAVSIACSTTSDP